MKWLLPEVAAALKVPAPSDVSRITSVSLDSRCVKPGALFFAIPGERFDGHDYVHQAFSQGAVAAVISRPIPHLDKPHFWVEDTTKALGDLAVWHRVQYAKRCSAIGITGSCGKTTTRALIASILKAVAPTLASQGSYNNQLGVPLTLLELEENHRFLVQEMGTNHPGEIAYLTELVRPDVGVITNAAPVHLSGLGSVDGVAQEKGDLYRGLSQTGIGVLNRDDSYAAYWQCLIDPRRTVTFSCQQSADVIGTQLQVSASGLTFQLHIGGESRWVKLRLLGEHNVTNALAASAVAWSLGVDIDAIVQGLELTLPEAHRLAHQAGYHNTTLIDDSYNANPLAMQAAIRLLAPFKGKRFLVIGDMLELGDHSEQYHREIGRYAKEKGVHYLYAYGELSREAAHAFREGAYAFENKVDLIAHLKSHLSSGDVVLVKGSRSMGMDEISTVLKRGI